MKWPLLFWEIIFALNDTNVNKMAILFFFFFLLLSSFCKLHCCPFYFLTFTTAEWLPCALADKDHGFLKQEVGRRLSQPPARFSMSGGKAVPALARDCQSGSIRFSLNGVSSQIPTAASTSFPVSRFCGFIIFSVSGWDAGCIIILCVAWEHVF